MEVRRQKMTMHLFLMLFIFIPQVFSAGNSGVRMSAADSINSGKYPAKERTDVLFHDFGEITEGDEPAYTFRFKNTSDKTIKILKVRVPCGCAKTELDKSVLSPGETVDFEILFKSRRMRGDIEKHLYLITDSKQFPIVECIIKASIKPKPQPVCESPSKLDIGAVAPNDKKTIVFRIENRGERELIIRKGIISSSLDLKYKLPATIAPGEKKMFELLYTAPVYEGKSRANLMLVTNDLRKPRLWIIVTAEIKK